MSSKAILSSPFAETSVALNAFNEFTAGSTSLYFMVGRGSFVVDGLDETKQWSVGASDASNDVYRDLIDAVGSTIDDTNPPTPVNTPREIEQLWDHLLYGKLIPETNVSLVMPTIQGGVNILEPWADRGTSSLNFVPYDEDADFTYGFTQNRFYIRDTSGETSFPGNLGSGPFEVFMAMKIDGSRTSIGAASNGEPSTAGATFTEDTEYFKDGTNSILTLGTEGSGSEDVWKYLYTIHADLHMIPIAGPEEDNFWIPVNYGNNTNQDDAPELPFIIGTRNIAIEVSLPADFDEIEFRQNWIVLNPEVNSTNAQKNRLDFAVDPENPTQPLPSGDVLYIENRVPQFKQQNQQENVLIAFNY